MRIVNKTEKISELNNGACYLFHGKVFIKIDLECKEMIDDETMCYAVDLVNGHCIAVKNSSFVKIIDPSLSY